MSLAVNSNNFKTEVLDCPGKVLVDFWAPWCGPCQMLTPIIEDIATEFKDKVKVVKVNTDEDTDLSVKYGVSSIPTVLFFDNGTLKESVVGFHQKSEYTKLLS